MRGLCLTCVLAFSFGCQPTSSGGSHSKGCVSSRQNTTALKLDGGIERQMDGGIVAAPSYLLRIFNSDDGQLLGSCTGTAVSSSTIMTAAHCVKGKGTNRSSFGRSLREFGLEVCLSRDDSQPEAVCSSLVYFDARFDGNEFDLSWVGFPIGTFMDFYEIASVQPSTGQTLVAVGYGPGSFGGPPILRYGLTSISSIDSSRGDGVFLSQYNTVPEFDEIKLVPGDSGGPVLNQCKISGVASKSRNDNKNEYVDLARQRDLLRGVSGNVDSRTDAYVHFCGLSVVYDDQLRDRLCPAAGLNVSMFPIESARDQFPCSRQAISTPKASEPAPADSSEPVIDQDDKVIDEVCQEKGK